MPSGIFQKVKVVDLLVGADLRIYQVIPDGNNFVDFSRPVAERNLPLDNGSFGKNVRYTKYGFFTQATKTLLKEKLKVFGSIRVDQNLEFSAKVNPRLAFVYTLAKQHHFRASIQNGFRFPALFEALSFVNNGNVRRVGGLSYINEGLGYLDNSYTLASVNVFNAAVNKDVAAGVGTQTAALNNKGLLEITNLSTTRPERINSIEVGYKSVLLSNSLVLDIDVYANQYKDFRTGRSGGSRIRCCWLRRCIHRYAFCQSRQTNTLSCLYECKAEIHQLRIFPGHYLQSI